VFARILVAGSLVSVCSLLVLGMTPSVAQASGYAGWSGYTSQVKRPQFRPWQPRGDSRITEQRWRPPARSSYQGTTSRYVSANRQAPPLLVTESRYSAPVSRAFARPASVGVRFRPNSRGAQRGGLPTGEAAQQVLPDPALHAQFRPKPTNKRPTYEQMQANSRTTYTWPTYAGSRYPIAPAGSSLMGAFAPGWGAGW
jgi:hypothetical protein